jgi:hypothetical protein
MTACQLPAAYTQASIRRGSRLVMQKVIARDVFFLSVLAVSITIFGGGIAAADDFAGKTYADALAAIGKSATPVIASRVGGDVPDDECIVTRSQKAKGADASGFKGVDKILLFVNCQAPMASATQSGNSAASPEFRAAEKDAKSEEWMRSDEGQQWCKTADKLHPEWHVMDSIKGCAPQQ